MSCQFPVKAKIHFFVEERLVTNPTEVFYAWCLNTQEAAEEVLLEAIRINGSTRIYGMYLHVE